MLLFTLFLGITGCGDSIPEKKGSVKTDLVIRPESEFEVPQKVQTELNELKQSQNGGHKAIVDGDRIYLIVALGERRTGGHSVEIKRAELIDNRELHVYAQEEAPPADSFTTQAISYPVGVSSIQMESPSTIKKFVFHVQKETEHNAPDR